MKNYLKLGLTLAVFASVACAGLAVVYAFTQEQIAINADKQLNESLAGLFGDAETFEPVTVDSPDAAVDFDAAYIALRGGEKIGLAIKARGPSYGGDTVLLVGAGPDRRLVGVRVLENKDTPGLGANAGSPNYYVDKVNMITFSGQFAGKSTSDPFEVKQDVQAITASTITSKAVAKVVKAAGAAAETWFDKAAGGN